MTYKIFDKKRLTVNHFFGGDSLHNYQITLPTNDKYHSYVQLTIAEMRELYKAIKHELRRWPKKKGT